MSSRGGSWCTAALVVLAAVASGGMAATLPNLYSVTVARDPLASDVRAAAEQAAMAKLLVRVTGNRNALQDPALQMLTADASSYLSSYGIDRQGRALVGFSRARVEQALMNLNLPVWGAERPLTLLWIAVDDGSGGRALLGADEATDRNPELTPTVAAALASMRAELAAVVDERGLPIALPLLDLQDLTAVTFTDVWGGFEDRVLAASQRYRADAVLIGRVRRDLVGTSVDWLFVRGTEREAMVGAGLRDGLDVAADRYAAELSTVGSVGVTTITVQGIAGPQDYGRVMNYIERQSVFDAVDVDSFENGTLALRVTARGDARVLGRVLSLGGVLTPVSNEVGGSGLVFALTESGPGR